MEGAAYFGNPEAGEPEMGVDPSSHAVHCRIWDAGEFRGACDNAYGIRKGKGSLVVKFASIASQLHGHLA